MPPLRGLVRLSFEVQHKKIKRQYTNHSVKCSYHTTSTLEGCILSYTHFTLEERKYLQQLLSEGLNFRKIAEILGRHPSTISREVKRNKAQNKPHRKVNNDHWYSAYRAQKLYAARRRTQHRRAIVPDSEQWNYIVHGLQNFWSPEAICGRWHMEHPDQRPLHFSTIYRYVADGSFPNIQKSTHLRRRGKRSCSKNSNYNTIHPDRIIPEHPEEIRDRSRIGAWEGDTVYGGIGKGALVTLVDRKSRFSRMGRLMNRTAEATRLVMEKLLANLPVKSISLDNGSEFAEFHKLEQNLNTLVYFAEPHSPWQRGTNENTNDIIRFFFPKGFDFRTVSEEEVALVENILNNRPRKCLNWKTPAEVFFDESVALG